MKTSIYLLLLLTLLGAAFASDKGANISCKNPGPAYVGVGLICGVGEAQTYDPKDDASKIAAVQAAQDSARDAVLGKLMTFTGVECEQDCDDPAQGCSTALTPFAESVDSYSYSYDFAAHTVRVKFCMIAPQLTCTKCKVVDQ